MKQFKLIMVAIVAITMQSTTSCSINDDGGGQIQVSEDANGKVKGTFNFTCKNQNDGSTKNITDGSFDLEKTEN